LHAESLLSLSHFPCPPLPLPWSLPFPFPLPLSLYLAWSDWSCMSVPVPPDAYADPPNASSDAATSSAIHFFMMAFSFTDNSSESLPYIGSEGSSSIEGVLTGKFWDKLRRDSHTEC
jgi:hypothetical protein